MKGDVYDDWEEEERKEEEKRDRLDREVGERDRRRPTRRKKPIPFP